MPIDQQHEIIHSTVSSTTFEGLLEKKTDVHVCSGFEIKPDGTRIPREYKRTVTTTSGPKSVMERRLWKPFGDMKASPATYGEEVFLKLNGQSKQRVEDDNRFYVGMAYESKFTPLEIMAVKSSDDPKEMFIKILNESYYFPALKGKEKEKEKVEPKIEPKGIGFLLNNDRLKKKEDEYKLTILLDNVPTWYAMEDIKYYLGDLRVERINIVKPRPGAVIESGGKVFIVLATEAEAQLALTTFNGAKWDNHIISAMVSKPRA